MHKKETVIKNQEGIASMVIVILIMTLLSLIVLSMTKNANREQRQALDRQLNSQAFYAAESGINDAKDYYTKNANNPIDAERAPEEKTKCDNSETGAAPGQQFPSYDSKVGDDVNHYSCVLYDATPDTLALDGGTNKSVLMPIEDESGDAIKSLTFTWRNKLPNNSGNPDDADNLDYKFSSCSGVFASGFPKSVNDDNCDAGVIRIELINPLNPLTHSRSDFIDQDFLAFAIPSSNTTTSSPVNPAYSGGTTAQRQGATWRGFCNDGPDGICQITINNINQNRLLLHLRSIYNENEIHISGVTTSDNTVHFKGAQMMVDATGRASDILKRIQVRVPLSDYSSRTFPEFSLQTANSICKLLQVLPSGIPDSDAQSSSDPSCSIY